MPPTDTIRIAGKALDKRVVYYGGAAAAGVVAYAYWRNSRDTGPEILTANPDLAAVGTPTDSTGFQVLGQNPPPQSNAEWSQLAIATLQGYGLDAGGVSSAIGKYLGKQPLTKTEQDLVRQAIAAAGFPPQGGPYTIIEIPSGGVQPPPPTETPPTPTPTTITFTDPTVSAYQITWRWQHIPGANYYTVYPIVYTGEVGGRPLGILQATDSNQWTWYHVIPGGRYGIKVTAYNQNQQEFASGYIEYSN